MLDRMRVFSLVAQGRSLSEAARQLGVSPATISRQILALEHELGAQLVYRSTRNISLTEAGTIFLARCGSILREVENAQLEISELESEPRGQLHVHSRGLVGRHLVTPVLSQMRDRYPGVTLRLTLSDAPLDLAERNVDVSIRGATDEGMALLVRKLGDYQRLLCASPEFVARHGVPTAPQDLAALPCVTFQFDLGPVVWRFRSGEQTVSVTPMAVAQSNDGEALRLLALQGLGVAMMPEWAVRRDIAAGRLVPLLEDHEAAPANAPFGYPVYALYQRTPHRSPKLKAFLDVLIQSMKAQAKAGWL
jgi:DNA-binding transcriptional LysR family regulator